MKIRNGFVSNSSSSSFIVGFKRKPKTVAEVKELLFGDEKYIKQYDYSLSTQEAAEMVFSDMHGKKPLTKSQMLTEFRSGWFEGYPHFDYRNRPSDAIRNELYSKFPSESENLWAPKKIKNKEAKALSRKFIETTQAEWAEQRKQVDEAAKEIFERKVVPTMKGYKVFAFNYSDNGDGERGSVMEHGNIFHNLPHFLTSQH